MKHRQKNMSITESKHHLDFHKLICKKKKKKNLTTIELRLLCDGWDSISRDNAVQPNWKCYTDIVYL